MIHPLQLRHSPTLEAAPDAWFIPGRSAERWLEELARAGLAGMETRLFAVPCSIESHDACAGLLAVPAHANAALPAPAGMPCRLIAGRLFVPADAVLHPPLTDSEVQALCPLPVSFFHPVFGLSGFEAESALRVSDLLQPPEPQTDSWNGARPGAPALPELTVVVLLQPPSIEDVFGGAENEIATDSPQDLPPAPDEPKEGSVTKAGRNLQRFFLEGVAGTLRRLPHTASHRTWANHLEDWANRRLHGVNEQVERLRHKELHRLLHLLDTDPEAGLRHAIPMSSFAHRGIAPPGARLGPRSLNFDPRRLGGGPADFWNVPEDLQEILRRRYREMADREMQLGRHRRAAYVYAQLLGDLVSAANALKQGRFFREAALLYEEHLHNPLEAARCLAEGGLLAEAIERYEKLGRWLEVADLHERAGNAAAAAAAIRRVVDERLAQDDILGAAKLLEERLHAPHEALDLLLQAWPSSAQAARCLGAAFQLMGRLGRHSASLEQLTQLNCDSVPDSRVLSLVEVLGGTARSYPHEQVRHRAADIARVLVASQLNRTAVSTDEAAALLAHLVRLAPQDRLLARDANRYLAERRSAQLRQQRVLPPPLPGNKPVVHRRFELPRQIRWVHLRREWHWFYALGVTPKRVTLLRGVWEGQYQSVSWDNPSAAPHQGFVFEPTAEQGAAVVMVQPGCPPFAQKRFPAADQFFNKECFAGTPAWLPRDSFPFAFGEEAGWTMHLAAGRAVLSCHSKSDGQLQRTLDITHELLAEAKRSETTHLSMAALRNGVAVALGNRLVLTRPDGGLARVELPGQVVSLFATIPSTRQGVAVMLEKGAVLYWVGAQDCLELERDMPSPFGAFVPGGPLVLVSGFQAVCLEVDSRGVKNVARLQLKGQWPVGVSATANAGEFAVLGEHGEMTIYRMPR